MKSMLFKYKKKPTIHLHIGTHKTGTTSLQHYLEVNTENLKKQGLLYPKSGWYHHSQHLLAFQLKNSSPINVNTISVNIWEDLKKEISTSNLNNIIISSEIFATLNKDQITLLCEKMSEYNVKVYLYLKRQDELFESMYNQQVKEWRNTRKETVQYFMDKKMKIYANLNYYKLVKNWIDTFGKDNVHIRPSHKKYGQNTITDFMSLMELDHSIQESFINIDKENISVSSKALEIIRLSKCIENDIEIRKKIFDLAIKYFPSTEDNKNCLTIDQKIKITAQFKGSNQKLIDSYFHEGKDYLLDKPLDNYHTTLSHQDLLGFIVKLVK